MEKIDKVSSIENEHLSSLISPHLKDLMKCEAIRHQFDYSSKEDEDELGTRDPQNEDQHENVRRLIHRYNNRAAFLTTDRCFAHCRHCFRRRFVGSSLGPATKDEIINAANYLKEHKEIREILLTGGDMFTLSDNEIDFLLSTLKESREDIIYRLCTRALLSNPDRFTPSLFTIIEKNSYGAPYVLMTQFNHPEEITKESEEIVNKFLSLHIPAFNQSVLLKDVNDSAAIQIELANKLLMTRIKPYYLFQGDLVRGTKHLRVPLSKGLEIEREMRAALSGLAMPQYTLDLPDGGGKVILTENHLIENKDGWWKITTPYGEVRYYPED